jgi:peptide/nickel transport system substrate-binding protein
VGLKRAAAAVSGALVLAAALGVAGPDSASASTRPGGGNSSSSTTTTLAGQGVVKILNGGTVTVAVASLPTQFNPWTPAGSNPVTEMVMEQVWPQAFVTGPRMVVHAYPGLVVSAELTGLNPQTVVYTLAKGARWSDGVPITAADFAYNWKMLLRLGPRLPSTFPLAGYEDITSVTGSNGGAVVTVTFAKPYADWMALFSDLVPAHIAERYGWEKAFAGAPLGHLVSGGPFVITTIIPGRELVLTRNPLFWGKPAHLAHIVFEVIPTRSATLRALADGAVDIAEVSPGSAVTNLVNESDDLVARHSLTETLWQLAFNCADAVTGQVVVREAIAKAIARSQLLADSVGLLTADAWTSGNRIYAARQPGEASNDSAYLAANTAEADELLAQVGYTLNADGLAVTTSGTPLVLALTGPSGDPAITAAENEIQAELLAAGIELRIHNVPLDELLASVLPQGRYELAIVPYLESAFPSTMAPLYTDPVGPTPVTPTGTSTSTSAPAVATVPSTYIAGTESEPGAVVAGAVTRDVLGYNDPTVDELFAEAQSQLNASANAGLYNEIDTLMWQDLPTLPLFQEPATLVQRIAVVNVSDTSTWAGPMWDAEDWAIQVSPPPVRVKTPPGS